MSRGPQIEARLGSAEGLDRQKLLVWVDPRRVNDPVTPGDSWPHRIGHDIPVTFAEDLKKLIARVSLVAKDESSDPGRFL